jgi:hypothetical protein
MLLNRVPGQRFDALVDHADARGVRVYAARHPSAHYPGSRCAVAGHLGPAAGVPQANKGKEYLWEPIAFER